MGKINPEAIRFDLVRDLWVSIPYESNFFKQNTRGSRLAEITPQFNPEFERPRDVLHDTGVQYQSLRTKKCTLMIF